MKEFFEIWDLIVKSNTFNFVLLVAIFVYFASKLDFSKILAKLQQDIINAIEAVKNNKKLAGEKLEKAKDSVKNLDSEIELEIKQANDTARAISETIFGTAGKRIETINNNVAKSIRNEEKSLSDKLTEKAASAAVALAKNHIINTLKARPDLQDKYINESIQELDRIQL